VTRRRLELLSAELAGLRPVPLDPRPSSGPEPGEPADPPVPPGADPTGGGGPSDASAAPGRHARRPDGLARLGGWLQDRLPPTLQGRVQLGTSQLTVVALLVALALAASAWFLLRADRGGTVVRARPHPVAKERPGGSPGSELLVTPATGPSPEAGVGAGLGPSVGPSSAPVELVVDVAGRVRHPGIVTLPVGARVVDALKAAGGVRRHVDLTALNLARPLTDGEQILVGVPQPAGVAASAASTAAPTAALVNLNTATEPELESLPAVGPVTAAAILKWRSENGPFTAVDQLLDVSGIGDKTLAEIAPFVTL